MMVLSQIIQIKPLCT